MASFFGNGTKFKTYSEIKPPLKKKAEDGVRVLIMIWGETTSIMGTHDTETENFFKGKKKTLFLNVSENSVGIFLIIPAFYVETGKCEKLREKRKEF